MSDTALTGSSAPPVITTEFIGPHEARDMLEQAAPNRKINDSLVIKYAVAMLDGDWHNIGVPVIVDDRGRMTDGQHRMRAVIESETVQQFTVAHGVDAQATLMAVDTGRKRTVSDILRIMSDDPENPRTFRSIRNLPSIAKKVMVYEKTGDMNINSRVGVSITHQRLLDFILANQHEVELAAAQGIRTQVAAPMILSGVAAAYYVCRYFGDATIADEFVREIINPSQTDGNAAWLLRQQATKDRLKRTSSWTRDARMCAAYFIKAFNLYRSGTYRQVLVWKNVGPHAEAFPTV